MKKIILAALMILAGFALLYPADEETGDASDLLGDFQKARAKKDADAMMALFHLDAFEAIGGNQKHLKTYLTEHLKLAEKISVKKTIVDDKDRKILEVSLDGNKGFVSMSRAGKTWKLDPLWENTIRYAGKYEIGDASINVLFGSGVEARFAKPDAKLSKEQENVLIAGGRTAPATLKSIASSEYLFQQGAFLDADADATGEFGALDALVVLVASGVENDDLIAAGMVNLKYGCGGICDKSGYLFLGFVPPNTDDAEESFCVVAWPAVWGVTGKKAFFINEAGSVYETENENGRLGNGSVAIPTLHDIYGTAFDSQTIIASTWSVMK